MSVRDFAKPISWTVADLRTVWIAVLGAILVAIMVAAASIGAVHIPMGAFLSGNFEPQHFAVLSSIRLPRVLLAAVVGGALALAGAAMQGLFRNPLADPGLIGISSGAMLAVAAVIVLAGNLGGVIGLYGLSIAAFVGALCASAIIFKLARLSGTVSVTYLLLAGIAVNAMGAAGTGFLAYLSDDTQLRDHHVLEHGQRRWRTLARGPGCRHDHSTSSGYTDTQRAAVKYPIAGRRERHIVWVSIPSGLN